MPSDKRVARRWRVKSGNREVFSDPVKQKCVIFARTNRGNFIHKLRLIPPNQ